MDIGNGTKVTEVLFLKHTFDESQVCVALQVYLVETAANSESVRVCCTETQLRIEFLNNGQPDESNPVWSRWHIALRGRIIPEQCSFRILANRARSGVQRWSAKLEIQLRKADEIKWVNLESSKSACDAKSDESADEWRTLANEPSQNASRSVLSSPKRADAAARGAGCSVKAGSGTGTKAVGKKPFCLVSPNNAQNTTFAGYTGIENQKNCCFMNAVLQVLANTRIVRDFAAQFKPEESEREEGESSCKRVRADGTEGDRPARTGGDTRRWAERERERERERRPARGELVRALCTMMNELWTGAQSHVAPTLFRTLFCAHYPQFAGSLQQDAHEFLTFLLDGLRDELAQRADEWPPPVHTFVGELRSEICCLECEHVSTRRDAFFCLSVPIPKPATRLRVFFMSYLPSMRPRPLEVELPASADDRAPCTLNVLRQVATRMRCRVPDLRMYEVHQGRFHRFFTPHSSLDEITPGDQLVVQQVLGPASVDAQCVELFVTQRVLLPNAQFAVCCNCHAPAAGLKHCKRCYRVAYCSRDCQVKHYAEHASWCRYVPALVGCPFILSVPRARASFDYICERMQQYALWSVDVTYRTPPPLLHALANTPAHTVASARSDAAACAPLPELVSPPVEHAHCVMDCAVCTNADGTHPQLALMLADASGRPFRVPKPDPDKSTKCEPEAAVADVRRKFMFLVKEADEHGLETGRTLIPSPTDSGEALELTGWKHVYMDWLNKDRNRPYVLVESKPALGTDTPFDDPAPPPPHPAIEGCTPSVNLALAGSTTIYDCLSSFTECEMLHAAEAWRCPRCDHLQAASKQLTISRPPDVLVVHLKRFKPNREKLDAHVDFPVLAFDIGKFVVRDGDAAPTNVDEDDAKTPTQSEYLYDLYATVNHFGVTTGGHYTAYARLVDAHDSTRSEFGWREFDDVNVKVLHDANVVRSRHAYLLFYKRRATALPLTNASS